MISNTGELCLTADFLSPIGVRFPLHVAGPGDRNIHDADDDCLFIGVPRAGARERAAAFVRMANIQHAKLTPTASFAERDAGFHSSAGA